MRLSVFEVPDQRAALQQLALLTQKSTVHPRVREAAMRMIAAVPARDDRGELEAIFTSVKNGNQDVKGLQNGVRYVADPRWADHFTAPHRLLEQCARGVCQGDCDDQSALVAALAGAIGFKVGLRAWGSKPNEYTHVYAVAALSKRNPSQVVGMDTTVPESYVGWEPPHGHVLTAWLE